MTWSGRLVGATLGAVCGLGGGAAVADATPTFARLGPIQLLGDDANALDLGVGGFNLFHQGYDRATGAVRAELRGGRKLGFLGPAAGFVATGQGGVLGYGAVYADLAWGSVVVTPLAGIAGYARGNGPDLGGVFQFRLSATLAYRFDGGERVGITYGHVSNAGTQPINPGAEELYLSFTLPF